jgi:hypothetical protein
MTLQALIFAFFIPKIFLKIDKMTMQISHVTMEG